MKKILFLIPTLMHGGAEKVLVNLVNNLDITKYDITLMTLFDVGVNKKYINPDVKYKYVFRRIFRGNKYLFKLFTPKFLHRLFIKERYDIEVSYLEGPTARIISGCDDPSTKLISWIHTEYHTKKAASTSFRTYNEARRCYGKFDNIICVSRTVLKKFEDIFGFSNKLEVLYNTNETNMIREKAREDVDDLVIDDNITILCSAGKITANKGYDRLVRIHKRLLDEGFNHRVYIFGIGEEKTKLEQWLKEKGLEGSFKFVGFRDNPYKYVGKSDLYVCSSHREGFSTAVTEALILGTPVVTTNCSGMEEMLGSNSEYGLITSNDEESLFKGIKKLLSSPNMLHHYKLKAMERGSYFSTIKTVSAVEEMFDRL